MRTVLNSTDVVQRQWKSVLVAMLEEEKISLAQFAALKLIADEQPIASRELSAKLWVTPGAITQLVDGLVEDGYVCRSPDARDRRVHNLSVSAEGRRKLQELKQKRRHIFAKVFEALSDEELQTLLDCQTKMLERLDTLQSVIHK